MSSYLIGIPTEIDGGFAFYVSHEIQSELKQTIILTFDLDVATKLVDRPENEIFELTMKLTDLFGLNFEPLQVEILNND